MHYTVVLVIINLYTKFRVSVFTRFRDYVILTAPDVDCLSSQGPVLSTGYLCTGT